MHRHVLVVGPAITAPARVRSIPPPWIRVCPLSGLANPVALPTTGGWDIHILAQRLGIASNLPVRKGAGHSEFWELRENRLTKGYRHPLAVYYRLFSYNRANPFRSIQYDLERYGWHAVRFQTLLFFGAEFSPNQVQKPVVSLGSVMIGEHHAGYPCLKPSERGWILELVSDPVPTENLYLAWTDI